MSSYDGPGSGDDNASALALSPDGRTLDVTGHSTGVTSDDLATVAFRTWASKRQNEGPEFLLTASPATCIHQPTSARGVAARLTNTGTPAESR
jgi:hypothetical protein